MGLFLRKKRKKTKIKVKHQLSVLQCGNTLTISGQMNKENYMVKELWLFSRETKDGLKIAAIRPATSFEFNLSLDEVMTKLISLEESQFDWYFKIIRPLIDMTENELDREDIEIVEDKGEQFAEYFIRCGRFQKTKIDGLTFHYVNGQSIINYITTKGNLSLVINNEVNGPIKSQIDKLKRRGSSLIIEGKMFTRNAIILSGEIVARGRETNEIVHSAKVEFISLTEQIEKKYGLNRYTYSATIDFSTLNNGTLLDEDIYDLFFKLDLHDHYEDKYVRIGRPTFRARFFVKELFAKNDREANVINPYFTFKVSNLSIEIYKYPLDAFHYLRKVMRWSWLIQFFNRNNDTWIVGERTYKAQDTGYAFYRYMRTEHPEKNVYYVIDRNSPERKNVEKYGNILDYKSKEHIFRSLIAKKVISSHHPDYLYPIRTGSFKRKVKADKFFLQHGVMGTKNMVANYGKNAPGFDTDFFMVSSDFEKEMIVNDFGYSAKNVFVTGLSRFDTLFANDVPVKRQILVIPTWRDWIVLDEELFESEYFERYQRLINSPVFHSMAHDYNFEIIFCLHPNMQKFSKYFENPTIKVVHQGEIDVQHLIKESALMITDYSSVGFDFSFLSKPVIYYQFDRERFIGKRPSHLDLDNDLPGEICVEQEQILDLVHYYATRNFEMKPEYVKRANKFIKYKDLQASERIYNVIRESKAKRKLLEHPKVTMVSVRVFNRYRKSRYYFPTMRLFYRIGSKVIPVDKKLILFESGLGKQYSDSPRNIYEEILRRNLDYKKVWVYNNYYRFDDPDTIRIQRLSPKYYYYLLRAGYWVNNQNFPTYIKKRPQTTYLQTWHGTPLKKMLFDLNEVHGRTDDYVDRVGDAIKNWDYLISPSKYATEAFKSAFRFKREILEVGYPRNDIFYKEEKDEIANGVKNRLKLDPNKKVILYAPTFRDNQTTANNKFVFDINMDLHQMQQQLGEDYILLLRMHVVVRNKIKIDEELRDFVYNVSNYPDIQELYLISDILMTDYSSVMFDFANTNRPMLFFTFDLEDYRDNLRGFYMDFENEAPGPLVFNTEEIIDSIQNIENVKIEYQSKYSAFRQKYCQLEDGNASKRVVDRVF